MYKKGPSNPYRVILTFSKLRSMLPLGHASGSQDMRSSMFAAYCLAGGIDVRDSIAAVAQTKLRGYNRV